MPLRLKLILAVVGVCTAVMVLLAGASIASDLRALRLERDQARAASLDRLATTLIAPLHAGDQDQVARLLRAEMRTNPHLEQLACAIEGQRLIAFRRDDQGRIVGATLRPVEPTEFHVLRWPADASVLGTLAFTVGDQVLGAVIRDRLFETLVRILVLLLVLTLFLGLVIDRLLLARVKGLARVLARYQGGMPPAGGDEMGRVIDGCRDLLDQLSTTFDAISDALVLVAADLRIERCNRAAGRFLRQQAERLPGQALAAVFDPQLDDRRRLQDLLLEVLSAARGQRVPHLVLDEGATERILRLQVTPLAASRGLVLLIHDATEEQELLEQLRQAQRMESLGKLSGGIAHDFNNMLAAIVGATENVLEPTSTPEQRRQMAETIFATVERAAQLNRKLLTFARKQHLQREIVDAVSILHQAVALLRSGIDRRITVSVSAPKGALMISADALSLVHAVLNLALNARDAISERGVITLELAQRELASEEVLAYGKELHAGSYAVFTVSDDGVGIPERIRARIYEPFFTTKHMEQHNGLGLAVVYGTVCSLGGGISMHTRIGAGSTFRVAIPIAREPGSGSTRTPIVDGWRGSGHLLVVDDDEAVRRVCACMLRSCGFTVSEATDGQAALDFFLSDPDRFDGVILDLMMPVLDGGDCFAQLTRIAPALPVWIISGYSDGIDVQGLLDAGAAGFLCKPFRRQQIIQALDRFAVARPDPA